MKHHNDTQSGFALLITLLVVSVVISIGLSILELSSKQVRLSNNSADSETAFAATNAGLECARYWRRAESDDFETGVASVSAECFGDSTSFSSASLGLPTSGVGNAQRYTAEFDWGADSRCSQIDMLVMSVPPTETVPLVLGSAANPVTDEFPGYPGDAADTSGDTKTCEPGGNCTIVSVRGYDAACSRTTTIGTIQREVLLQF